MQLFSILYNKFAHANGYFIGKEIDIDFYYIYICIKNKSGAYYVCVEVYSHI